MPGRPHPPSQMRALLQEWKQGRRTVRQLLPEARAIDDPSFAAEALFAFATDPALDGREATQAALEALRLTDRVERDWRRAEALAAMAPHLPDLRGIHAEAARPATDGVVDRVLGLPAKLRAEATRAIAPHLDAEALPRLMARALASEEAPYETGKAILKAAAESGAAAAVLPALRDALDPELRLRMLGAWAARMAATQPEEAGRVLGTVLGGLEAVAPAVRLDVVRAIVAATDGAEALHAVRAYAQPQDDEAAARILSAVGARADRLGHKELAQAVLREAETRAGRIADGKARASVQRNVQEGLRRAGLLPEGAPLLAPPGDVAGRAGGADAPASAAEGGADAGHAAPGHAPAASPEHQTGQPLRPAAATQSAQAATAAPAGRHVLALVDTYEGGLGDVHLRAVARAAPLCDAFGLDLALVGFPVKDLASFVKRAGRETNVGEGRGSLESLHKAGRLHLVPWPAAGVPDFSGVGTPVATTPSPDPAKASLQFPEAGRLCVLVGLGPKGLPDRLLSLCGVHVEVTGKGVSLETATAMGVIAERMRAL